MKQPCVYITASKPYGTLYTGVTAHLNQRSFDHKEGHGSKFTARYGCNILVYCEFYTDIREAIAREKQIKGGSRAKKLELIKSMNPEWKDLYNDLA